MKIKTLTKTMFFIAQDMLQAQVFEMGPVIFAVFSSRSPDKDTVNEDSAVVIPLNDQSCVFAIADGAGGQRAGSQASQIAVQEIHKAVKGSGKQDRELRENIINGIENANREVTALGVGASTTLAIVEVNDKTIRPYHVGDSEILISGQRGKVKLQTLSHSPVAYAVEAGLINEQEALQHEERHIVSNMIGSPDMRMDLGPSLEMSGHDTLVMGSDGLFDNLVLGDIIESIRKGPIHRVAEKLAEKCQQNMNTAAEGQPSKPDDLTFIVMRRKQQTQKQK